ncbi:MAG: Flp pilus assembly complex ATPase component TadA [Verrucomicrobiae bacterium]|nr:Flp pilus assembly complex ATPase component TadA [Verrucomicrobiae bacterium]
MAAALPMPATSSTDLGNRLIASGLINETQLDLATREQRRKGQPLSKVLVDLGLVPAEKISDYLAQAAQSRRVHFHQIKLDRAVTDLVPRDLARRFKAVPIAQYNGTLTVAMADPSNVVAIDHLGQLTGKHIDVVTATERDILNALDRLDAEGASIQQAIDQIIEDQARDAKAVPVATLETGATTDDEAPTIRLVSQIIERAIEIGASDIHFEPEERLMRIRVRIDGVLHPDVLIPKALQALVASRMKILADLDVSETRVPQDGRATVTVGRRQVNLRVSSLPTTYGESIVARILNPGTGLARLTQLGLPPDAAKILKDAMDQPHGVVIVTGPTGSGKTTTLYAVLNEISSTELSIFTLEDPVEIRMAGVRQTQIKDDIGLTFSAGLRSLLRQDPDVILVGETRDVETAQLMIRAALTGHLVFSTLHTNDAPGAIPRLLDMGVEPFLLPDSLLAVLAQRLVRKLCPKCKEPVGDPERVFQEVGVPVPEKGPLQLWRNVGCETCSGTGFKGRQGIFELMQIDHRFHDPIVRRAGAHEFARLAREGGMATMFEDGLRVAMEGTTTIQELLRVTRMGGH